jgi:hypothetical protein
MPGVIQLVAIDPGSEQSAFVAFDDAGALRRHGKLANDAMLSQLAREQDEGDATITLAIEMIASYGMAVGRDVFETCVWIGRFVQAWRGPCVRVFRRDVKLHLCADSRAKDSNIRQALIDRYGPGKGRAIGTKKQPGPLYRVTSDVWSALAVAVTVLDGAVRSAA